MSGKLGKLLLLNGILFILNLLVFSGGIFRTLFGDDTVRTVIAAVVVVISVIVFFWGNISILFGKKPVKALYQGDELGTKKDYIKALEAQRSKKVFQKEINKSVEQLNRIRAKNDSLNTLLLQYFSPQEMTSVRFRTVIESVNDIFYDNIKKMINRMIIFDEKDYMTLIYKIKYNQNPPLSPQEVQASKDRLNLISQTKYYKQSN